LGLAKNTAPLKGLAISGAVHAIPAVLRSKDPEGVHPGPAHNTRNGAVAKRFLRWRAKQPKPKPKFVKYWRTR
jgi:hypothetical protein